MSGSIRFAPGASGRGLSLSLTPAWGADAGSADRRWSARDAAALTANDDTEASGRLDAQVGYGVAGPDRLGTVTPYTGVGLAGEDARIFRIGARWTLGPDASLGLEGTRRESVDDDQHGLILRGALRW